MVDDAYVGSRRQGKLVDIETDNFCYLIDFGFLASDDISTYTMFLVSPFKEFGFLTTVAFGFFNWSLNDI